MEPIIEMANCKFYISSLVSKTQPRWVLVIKCSGPTIDMEIEANYNRFSASTWNWILLARKRNYIILSLFHSPVTACLLYLWSAGTVEQVDRTVKQFDRKVDSIFDGAVDSTVEQVDRTVKQVDR